MSVEGWLKAGGWDGVIMYGAHDLRTAGNQESVMNESLSNGTLSVDVGAIQELDLPATTKTFLQKHGLPRMHGLFIRLSLESGKIPTLWEFCAMNALPKRQYANHLYRIGTDEASQICLVAGTGEVVAVDVDGGHTRTLMNSTLEGFARLLEEYRYYASEVQATDNEDEAGILVARTISRMRESDPSAFLDDETWWSLVCEQMEHGML